MKKLLLSALCVVLGATAAMADSYTITFKDNGAGKGDASSALKAEAEVSSFVADGASYVTGIESTNNVYLGKDGYGLKFSSSSKNGNLVLNLAEAVTPTSIVINAADYNTSSASVSINGATAQSLATDKNFADYTFTGFGEISTISIGATGRIYVKSITVNYEAGEVSQTKVATPAISFADREVTISCATEGAKIVYSLTRDEEAVTTDAEYAAPFQLEGYGKFTVTATATKEGLEASNAATASTTFAAPMTFAEFMEAKPTVATPVLGPIQTIYQNGARTWIKGGDTYAMIYSYDYDGKFPTQTVIDGMTATVNVYRGLPQVVPTEIGATSPATEEILPVEKTDLVGIDASVASHYYLFKGLKVVTLNGNTYLEDAPGAQVQLYDQLNLAPASYNEDATYNVTGFITVYNTTVEVIPVEVVENPIEDGRQDNELTLTPAQELYDVQLGDAPIEIAYAAKTAVTVESTQPDVAKVEAVDGTATITLMGAGTTEIIFTAAETDEYRDQTMTVTVTVTDPNGPKDVTFDFTTEAALTAMGVTEIPASNAGTDLTELNLDGIVLTFTDGSNPARIYNGKNGLDLRLYKTGTMTVTSPEGTALTEITFSAAPAATADRGSFDGPTWTPAAPKSEIVTLAESANNQVVFTINSDAKTQTFTSITVKFAEDTVSAITEVESNDAAPVEYFNLQGRRVLNPANGVFIQRQGSRAVKVIL